MKTTKPDYYELAKMTEKPINLNTNCNSYNAMLAFYTKPMGTKLGEPYKNMEKKRMVSILAKAIVSKKLTLTLEKTAEEMINRLGY